MKHNQALERLFAFLATQGLVLRESQQEQVAGYLALLDEWGKKQNLVSRHDRSLLVERHITPSFFYVWVIEQLHKGMVERLDFGTGAGLPGVIMAIYYGDSKTVLLDSNRKKMIFLRRVIKTLSLNVMLVNERLEQWRAPGCFKLITARAVAGLEQLWEYVKPILCDGGVMLTLKGDDFRKEINFTKFNDVHWRVIKPNDHWIAFAEDLRRKVIVKMEFAHGSKRPL